jgi:phage/plasmid-associated DNA primase
MLNRARQLMRALIFVGPPQSGKSNLLTVLSGMFTKSPNTTTFDLLENTHGTTDFLRNVPWVLHEAFDQSKWHFSATVKSLLSGDPISINIKNGPIVERRFKLPVFWGTNSPPQFKEASRAIETRVRIVRCKQSFDPAEVTGVAKEAIEKGYASPAEYVLDTEMSGLLNWFIEGMQRAAKRGYLADTDEMKQSAKDMRTNANIMVGFFEEAVDYSYTHMVSLPDFLAAYRVWWEENRGEGRFAPSSDMVVKSIESLYDGRVAINSKLIRYNTKRYIAGVSLNEMGLALWKANFNATAAKGDSARISSREEDVNVLIPEEWFDRKIIRNMVEAHTARKET